MAPAQISTASASASRTEVSREGLEQLLVRLEATAASDSYSREVRMRARQEAALIRARLTQGDFQPGDRVSLYVEEEPALSDTFAVSRDYTLALPMLGDVPLQGILYSELEPYIRQQIARRIKEPVVRVQPLVRLAVLGEVGQPGFYLVPPSRLVTELVMEAGGPTRGARITEIYIVRDDERIWGDEALQEAIVEGRTLEQLGVRAGDRIVVPDRGLWNVSTIAQVVGLVGSISYLIVRLSR